jgi:hypothetical protein
MNQNMREGALIEQFSGMLGAYDSALEIWETLASGSLACTAFEMTVLDPLKAQLLKDAETVRQTFASRHTMAVEVRFRLILDDDVQHTYGLEVGNERGPFVADQSYGANCADCAESCLTEDQPLVMSEHAALANALRIILEEGPSLTWSQLDGIANRRNFS